jgi:cell division protein FtsB
MEYVYEWLNHYDRNETGFFDDFIRIPVSPVEKERIVKEHIEQNLKNDPRGLFLIGLCRAHNIIETKEGEVVEIFQGVSSRGLVDGMIYKAFYNQANEPENMSEVYRIAIKYGSILGMILLARDNITSHNMKLVEEAVELYKQASQKGNVVATHMLAYLHSQGRYVEKDVNKALTLYARNVAKDYAASMNNLAQVYHKNYSKYKNADEIIRLYMAAEKRGTKEATKNLLEFYCDNYKKIPNKREMIEWLIMNYEIRQETDEPTKQTKEIKKKIMKICHCHEDIYMSIWKECIYARNDGLKYERAKMENTVEINRLKEKINKIEKEREMTSFFNTTNSIEDIESNIYQEQIKKLEDENETLKSNINKLESDFVGLQEIVNTQYDKKKKVKID